MTEEKLLLKVDGVSHTYIRPNGEPYAALREVNFTVEKNEILCIVGPSGCGKTTLLKIIAGLLTPSNGRVLVNRSNDGGYLSDVTGESADKRNIGFVFQSEKALFPHLNVYENIEFPFRYGKKRIKEDSVDVEVNRIINRMSLSDFDDRPIHELSGGMKQRVAISRALVYKPNLLILDEPLTSLDNARKDSILEIIMSIKKEIGTTILHVTHDDREVKKISDKIMVLKNGRVICFGSREDVLRESKNNDVKSLLRL